MADDDRSQREHRLLIWNMAGALLAVIVIILVAMRWLEHRQAQADRLGQERLMLIALRTDLYPALTRYLRGAYTDVDGDRRGEITSFAELFASGLLDGDAWQRREGLVLHGPYALRLLPSQVADVDEEGVGVLAVPVMGPAGAPPLLLDESGGLWRGPADFTPGQAIDRAAWEPIGVGGGDPTTGAATTGTAP